ncbi:hypothetical protein ACS0TY_004147 [Phlomoides rotata]
MAPGGPKNLKQKRNLVARTNIKGVFSKENGGTRGRRDTTQQSKGGPTIASHPTIESDNTPPNFAAATSHIPSQVSEISGHGTSQIPSIESVQHTTSEDVVAPTGLSSKKKVRGPTIGRPKNADKSAKLASQIGVVTRDVLPVPIKWKDVDETNELGPGFDHLQIHMDVNIDTPGVKRCLVDRIKISTRNKRFKLHKHFLQFATLQEAKNNKPNFCPSNDNWETLCDHFASDKFKRISEVNQRNRQKLTCKHVAGRKAFTVRANEISERELGGEPCDDIDFFERTHSSSSGAKEKWETMKKKREEYVELGIEKSSREIMTEVLGHGTGYIKGIGYGPKPPSKRNKLYDSSNQSHDELENTKEKLQESEAQVQELKTKVTVLNDELVAQGANISKLMAFLQEKGMDL